MERLIRDLLDVSAIECGTLAIDPAAVRPIELLSESVDAHAAASAELGIGLSLDCDEPLPEIAADLQRLLQILGNLLGNAMKFTPRGGRIVVGAAQEVDGRHVRFWVSDSGPGIPLDQLPHVFNKFSPNGRDPGTESGLGLAICKAIVDAHGGRIWVESGARAGTTVSFTMPCDDAARRSCQAGGDRVHGTSERSRGEIMLTFRTQPYQAERDSGFYPTVIDAEAALLGALRGGHRRLVLCRGGAPGAVCLRRHGSSWGSPTGSDIPGARTTG